MFKYIIQVVGHFLVTAILLAMMLSLFRGAEKKYLLKGAIGGIAASFLLAFLKYEAIFVNREYGNIVILCISIFSGLVFCALTLFSEERKNNCYFHALYGIAGGLLAFSLILYTLPDVLLYPTEFLAIDESAFNTGFLFKNIGYLIGLLLVGLTGWALYKTVLPVGGQILKKLFLLLILLNMVTQVTFIIQVLLARRFIPTRQWLFDVISPLINAGDIFTYIFMLLTLLAPFLAWKNSAVCWSDYKNPAEERKALAARRRQKYWRITVLTGYILCTLTLTALVAYNEQAVALSPAEPMEIVGKEILIPLANINDGRLHRYNYTASEGAEMRFIIIKKNEVAYGVGLDACDICGPTGYYERDGEVICKLCDVVMNKSTIGFKGGCNPVPLEYSLRGGNMVIQTENLDKEQRRFK